jgi:hypothetical protein
MGQRSETDFAILVLELRGALPQWREADQEQRNGSWESYNSYSLTCRTGGSYEATDDSVQLHGRFDRRKAIADI